MSDAAIVAVATSRTGIRSAILPRSRADDARVAPLLQPDRPVARRSLVVLVPIVRDPLADAAAHVEQAERIGLRAADLRRLILIGVTIAVAALAARHPGTHAISPPIFGALATARGIFPLGFGRQPERLAGRLREPGEIGLR